MWKGELSKETMKGLRERLAGRSDWVRSAGTLVVDGAVRVIPKPRRFVVQEALGRLPPGRYPVETEPPPMPPGCVPGLPDFIGVGAQRCGSTWWFLLLESQRAIHYEAGVRKERHFFDRFFDTDPTPEDVESYARWFPRPPGKLSGEWTACYMHHFWVPPLIARVAPDAKLIVMLRDPIERYRSGLTWEMHYGALPRFSYADDAFARGLYGAQLERLRASVDPSKILVLQYERCLVDVAGQLRRTLEFLGIDSEPKMVERQINVTTGPKVGLPNHVRDELVARYTPDIRALMTMAPDLDVDLWPGMASAL
jgi:hypothetical protein